jgi:hypothetical protein
LIHACRRSSGERRIDLARAFGYSGADAITQVLNNETSSLWASSFFRGEIALRRTRASFTGGGFKRNRYRFRYEVLRFLDDGTVDHLGVFSGEFARIASYIPEEEEVLLEIEGEFVAHLLRRDHKNQGCCLGGEPFSIVPKPELSIRAQDGGRERSFRIVRRRGFASGLANTFRNVRDEDEGSELFSFRLWPVCGRRISKKRLLELFGFRPEELGTKADRWVNALFPTMEVAKVCALPQGLQPVLIFGVLRYVAGEMMGSPHGVGVGVG